MKIKFPLPYLLLSIILITLSILVYNLKKESGLLEPVKIYNDVIIENNTTYDIELRTKIMAKNILGYNDLYISFNYMDTTTISSKIYFAFIEKDIDEDKKYHIYINRNIEDENLCKIIAHEMIHLDQFESGILKYYNGGDRYLIYYNDTIDLMTVPYLERQHEIDAYVRTFFMAKKLDSIYRKKFR